ncbi:sensor histidine kinase [Acidipropionibacterium acidipropionici]|uniref:sensor histidine kinase n=1 Tax=Acidipropionibacterium acidipropionici TaxID=1748 RepID=UPI00110BD200|nr:histidine kinase [Acidipropionibacterium acidipropionici]QCV95765.1 histidine kinase [Acidipropionibacterium acidipropionici]
MRSGIERARVGGRARPARGVGRTPAPMLVAAGIWLGFAVFPIVAVVFDESLSDAVRTLSLVAIGVFIACYLVAFWTNADALGLWLVRNRVRPRSWVWLGILVALVVLLAVWSGAPALTMWCYVVAYAVFLMPGWTVGVLTGTAVVAVITALMRGAMDGVEALPLIGMALVLVFGFVARSETRRDIEAARARDAAARLGERERIASDVHDLLGQSLTVMAMKAELVERLVDTDPQVARAQARELHDMSRESLSQIRALVGGLQGHGVDGRLAEARVALRAAGIDLVVQDTRASRPPDAETDAFDVVRGWVLRESVTNVIRHSGAATCTIDVADERLRIADDGVGLQDAAEGEGRAGMRRRVEAAGGEFWIGPGSDGRGVAVVVTG